jgi:hypothetical protein
LPAEAAAQLLAANVGVTLALIAQPEDATDLTLSDRVREVALAGIVAEREGSRGESPEEVRRLAALALNATLDDVAVGQLSGDHGPWRRTSTNKADATARAPLAAREQSG